MDQDLKQRLVGAVVITSLAAIFIPMLFDDPIDDNRTIRELELPDEPYSPFKSNSDVPTSVEDVVSLPEISELKQTIERERPVSRMPRWYVQVGIFSEKGNAFSFQDKIRRQGFPVSITTVSGGDEVLYRVRVGPEVDKKRAELMKQNVEKLNDLKGIMISSDE